MKRENKPSANGSSPIMSNSFQKGQNYIDFTIFKDFQDFIKKTGMQEEEARNFLLNECKKKGILEGSIYGKFRHNSER